MTTDMTIRGADLADVVGQIQAAPRILMAIGRPVCPACQMATASMSVIRAARPDVMTVIVDMATEDDWAVRESVLWPWGIRVSPAAVPALVLMESGRVVATRQGAAPAADLDAWITEFFGPPVVPVRRGIADGEQAVLDRTAARRAQHGAVRGR
ncbi:MAG: thioredoxin [Thermoleophilia bacterium]|nr:thioredoxin [Thermoleophilia bacterium]